MVERVDVVVVGGGIGGSALAYALASEGLGVTVLEATAEYEDRVRGESMQVWGVAEAQELGVEPVLLAAGAHIAPTWKNYVTGTDDAGEIPMAILRPGVEGTLNLRHPDACQALTDAAEAAGAAVRRGVRDVKLSGGRPVSVSYDDGGQRVELTAGLVVGADGRASVVRRQTGITLERQDAISYIAGLLVDGLDGVPDDHDVMAAQDEQFFTMFHQGGGRARTYLIVGAADKHRFAGADGTATFLDSTRHTPYPWAGQVASGAPAGPCATFPGDDTWTDCPFAEGVVLIGDAAGHNDPIIGQGLAIALRDARSVRDAIVDEGVAAVDFRAYAAERVDRMERLRLIADVLAVVHVEDGATNRDARRAWFGERIATMDPELFPLVVGAFAGPETVPDELVDRSILDRIRAA